MHYYIDATLNNVVQIKQIKHFFHIDSCDIRDEHTSFDFWQFVYVERGSFMEYSDDKGVLLTTNDILFHKPGEISMSQNFSSSEHTKAYFVSFVCHSPIMNFFDGYKNTLSEDSMEFMKKLIEEAKKTFDIKNTDNISMVKRSPTAPLGGFQMFKIYMESLLINILREESQKSSNQFFLSNDDFDNYIHQSTVDFLMSNIYEDISLDDICNKLNYGKTFLCSKFKNIEGISIINYLNMLKIDEACKLIKTDKYSMSNISAMLKFNNPYYFSRVFKRVKGVSPMEYKKMGRKS